MHEFGVREVERLLRLPRSTLRALVDAGFVSPARGPRNAWRFSFQDLIVLRTAQALVEAKVPAKRINRSIRRLRGALPESMPLSGLSIRAEAGRIVVREGGRRWQADSGQYLLAFEGDPAAGSLSVRRIDEPAAQDWLERAVELEATDAEAAAQAYARAIAADARLLEAHVNLGRLLHEAGRLDEAESVYARALGSHPGEPLLHYNRGVLLCDLGRKLDAVEAYEAALRLRPRFADCLYNLALLCEELERPRDAIRHMAQYRRLTGGPG
ncbi:MAG: tetratricopeptide repeat protein [Betaproteobacteria bacterium]